MQDIVVKRIDEGLGLVLQVPSEPTVSPGFVHISNIADTKVDKLQQVRRHDDACTSYSVRTAVNRQHLKSWTMSVSLLLSA